MLFHNKFIIYAQVNKVKIKSISHYFLSIRNLLKTLSTHIKLNKAFSEKMEFSSNDYESINAIKPIRPRYPITSLFEPSNNFCFKHVKPNFFIMGLFSS